MKKFIIFFLYIPLVYSEKHRFITTYTGISGQTIAGTPEFSAVTTLDDQQTDYYDSNIMKLIPKQNWMEEFTSEDMWKDYIKIREKQHQIYKNNIHVLIKTFTQSHSVHTYRRTYGCEWNETEDSHGFDQYAYDGEDFISLDLKENRYITPVPQGVLTVKKWNNDREQLTFLKQYYDYKCVSWLIKFLYLSKATSKKTDPPKVSLLQKNLEEYVECHVTGFRFRNTTILWRKNGQALSDPSNLVKSGDTFPSGDGTFQRRVTLYVLPDEWKKNNYTCVVEHKSLTEPIQKILTEDQIMRSILEPGSDASYIMSLVPDIITVIVGVIVLIGLFVLWKCRNKLKDYSKKIIYFKTKSSQEPAPSQESLLSIPSTESTSRRKP